MDTLGTTIRKHRQSHGWTQEQLAEKIDMSQRWVSNIENDNVDMPRIKHIRRLADVFGIDAGVLMKAIQYTENVRLGNEIAEMAPASPELPPHLRTLFHKMEDFSPERLKRTIQLIEEQAMLDELDRERLKKDEG